MERAGLYMEIQKAVILTAYDIVRRIVSGNSAAYLQFVIRGECSRSGPRVESRDRYRQEKVKTK